MEHTARVKRKNIFRPSRCPRVERIENSRSPRRAHARARARAAVARACLRVCGEAVTHPAGEGERERVLFPAAGNNEWGWGSIYRLEKHTPAVSGNCVASRSSLTPLCAPFYAFLPSSSSRSRIPRRSRFSRADSEAVRLSRSFKFASEKRSLLYPADNSASLSSFCSTSVIVKSTNSIVP